MGAVSFCWSLLHSQMRGCQFALQQRHSEERAHAQRCLGSRINRPQERGRSQTLVSGSVGYIQLFTGAHPEARLKLDSWGKGNHVFCR